MFATDTPQTINKVLQDITNGDDPWVAIGNFSHDWYGNYAETSQRLALVTQSIEIPEEDNGGALRQWGAFCAASVEYLCQEASIPVPAWVENPTYMLSREQAFYTSPLAFKLRVRERLEQEAPEPFKKRNVFCSPRVYANKYERLTA